MGPGIEKLLTISSPALGNTDIGRVSGGRLFDQLSDLLRIRNGFYALEGALHLYGAGENVAGRSVQTWNASSGWRASFDGLADDYYFFAEDALGCQFAFLEDRIVTFDPETGSFEDLAADLEGWAAQVLAEPELLTGFSLAHSWQRAHGALELGARLVPKRPFVLGGEFVESNLYAADAIEGMMVRGELARQIRDLPDGTQIQYRLVE